MPGDPEHRAGWSGLERGAVLRRRPNGVDGGRGLRRRPASPRGCHARHGRAHRGAARLAVRDHLLRLPGHPAAAADHRRPRGPRLGRHGASGDHRVLLRVVGGPSAGAADRDAAGRGGAQPSNVRLVFFLSDGENTNGSDSDAGDGFASFADLAQYIDGGAVLGYGPPRAAGCAATTAPTAAAPAPTPLHHRRHGRRCDLPHRRGHAAHDRPADGDPVQPPDRAGRHRPVGLRHRPRGDRCRRTPRPDDICRCVLAVRRRARAAARLGGVRPLPRGAQAQEGLRGAAPRP